MIGTTPKPFEEINNALKGYEKAAIIGCEGCAAQGFRFMPTGADIVPDIVKARA